MELRDGEPATAWRRLDQWAKAGVFDRLHLKVLDRLGLAGRLDWSRARVDSASVRAKRGDHVGANPVERGKPASKLHLVTERRGVPLTAAVTAANLDDTLLFEALLDDVPAVLTPARQRQPRPGAIDAARPTIMPPTVPGYGAARSPHGALLGDRGVGPAGRQRWGIERTLW
jgi:hypothetical protein